MSTITDLLVPFLGTYDTTVTWDVPYITGAVLLCMGCWFAFKVVLVIIHHLAGGKE